MKSDLIFAAKSETQRFSDKDKKLFERSEFFLSPKIAKWSSEKMQS